MNIQRSVALVTGANRGLGKELVRALLARGARKIYAAARDPSTIDVAAIATSAGASTASDPPAIIPLRLDVTSAEDLAALATAAPDVSLVINNAGISRGSSLLGESAIAAAHDELATNVFGPLAVTRALVPALARHPESTVVNVLSVLSWVTLPAVATYSLSKSAAWSMTNGLRTELAAQRTHVIAVHVGFMDTDMAAFVTQPKIAPAEVARLVLDGIESNAREVLADGISKTVKSALSSENAPYLGAR
jgi:NAD(P)-dependent dehydrogenase (short-subunit alcohol dehydrogenase family)